MDYVKNINFFKRSRKLKTIGQHRLRKNRRFAKEAREKLNRVKPLDFLQASRVFGVNPADLSVILIWLKENKIKN